MASSDPRDDRSRRGASIEKRRTRAAWLFLAPCLLALLLAAGYPFASTVALSFTDARLLDFDDSAKSVGMANYRALLDDDAWWRAVRNTALFSGVSVSLELALGLAIALLLNEPLRFRGALIAVLLLPWAIPTVVAAQLWRWIFNDVYGVANDLLLRAGVLDAPLAWLADGRLAMGSAVVADVWKTTPFVALLLLAGLQAIPREIYEAAKTDGAGPWSRFRHVTLPLLMPSIAVAAMFRALDALRVFDLIYVLTGTRPETMSMAVYARQQLIDFGDLGYGSAVSVGVFLVAGMLVSFLLVSMRTEVD
jgi:trehalose/maltose transport system permease protein